MKADKKLLKKKRAELRRELSAKHPDLRGLKVTELHEEAMNSQTLRGYPKDLRAQIVRSLLDGIGIETSFGSGRTVSTMEHFPKPEAGTMLHRGTIRDQFDKTSPISFTGEYGNPLDQTSIPKGLAEFSEPRLLTTDLRELEATAEEMKEPRRASMAASLVSDRFRDALGMLDGPRNVGSDENFMDTFEGKFKKDGKPIDREEFRELLRTARAELFAHNPEVQSLFRALFAIRIGVHQDVDWEKTLKASTLAIQIFDSIFMHPAWFELQQKSSIFETEASLCARLFNAMDAAPGLLTIEEFFACCEALRETRGLPKNPCWNYFFRSTESHNKLSDGKFTKFMYLWASSGFARLNVGQKLAAALALTDAPEIPLHAPWHGWSLVIPDGFFQDIRRDDAIHETEGLSTAIITLKRAWFIETELVCVIGDNSGTQGGSAVIWCDQIPKVLGKNIAELIKNLAMGAIAAIENHPARSVGQWGAVRSKTNPKRLDAPAIGANYELAAPITVDLRDALKKMIKDGPSRKGQMPKAYWVVCGHWKQQVHGLKRGLRKTIWIQPYPKGDPSLKVLMRTVKVEE